MLVDPVPFRCRVEEFIAIVPKQPYRPQAVSNEVRMEFEAVLLDAQRERQNQLWIHAKIKACVREEDCVAVRQKERQRDTKAVSTCFMTFKLRFTNVMVG